MRVNYIAFHYNPLSPQSMILYPRNMTQCLKGFITKSHFYHYSKIAKACIEHEKCSGKFRPERYQFIEFEHTLEVLSRYRDPQLFIFFIPGG